MVQAIVSTFKLGWNFTAGETIRQQQDITPNVTAITLPSPNVSTVQLQSYSPNNTVHPLQWTSISFLGYKSMDPTLVPAGDTYMVS